MHVYHLPKVRDSWLIPIGGTTNLGHLDGFPLPDAWSVDNYQQTYTEQMELL